MEIIIDTGRDFFQSIGEVTASILILFRVLGEKRQQNMTS